MTQQGIFDMKRLEDGLNAAAWDNGGLFGGAGEDQVAW
jgi:hypothetical protein